MNFRKPKSTKKEKNKKEISDALKRMGWFVRSTHGNQFQRGFPDLYCCHPAHGAKWIECKNPWDNLRNTQIDFFKELQRCHIPVWICETVVDIGCPKKRTGIFRPGGNWQQYWKDKKSLRLMNDQPKGFE